MLRVTGVIEGSGRYADMLNPLNRLKRWIEIKIEGNELEDV